MPKRVYLALGSNLGDRAGYLLRAIAMLESPDLNVTRRSSIYETEPRELAEQPWFLNMVVEAETRLFPRQLLARTQRVEALLGRKRTVLNGPRTIDIDILLFGDSTVAAPDLVIPHPRMCDRRFVLEPLAELAPGLLHPVTHSTVRELLAAVANQSVHRLKKP